jgi:hypothetical protein
MRQASKQSLRGQCVCLSKFYISISVPELAGTRLPNPTIHTSSYYSNEDVCMVRLVIIGARHSAKIRAKSSIVLEKNYCNHCAPMQWNGSFWPKFHLPASQIDSILKSKTCCSIAHTEYVMGCTVNNLLKLWVCKLSFLKRHPSVQNSKITK